jgi:four helix bundle protein
MSLPHHKLVVWQRADDLFIAVHRVTHQHFPPEEKYELGSQLRRSAYSIPSNIVEGNARSTTRDTIKFFNIASSSLSETGYGLHAAHRLGYLNDGAYAALERQVREVGAPLHGLIRHKRAKLGVKARRERNPTRR